MTPNGSVTGIFFKTRNQKAGSYLFSSKVNNDETE